MKKPGFDVWGNNFTVNNLPSYECVNCQKTIASTRYAPHLEKCLGLAGRQSSRVASRRIGNSPSMSSDDNGTASPDSDIFDRNSKKKKHAGSVSRIYIYICITWLTLMFKPSFANGVSRVKKLKYTE